MLVFIFCSAEVEKAATLSDGQDQRVEGFLDDKQDNAQQPGKKIKQKSILFAIKNSKKIDKSSRVDTKIPHHIPLEMKKKVLTLVNKHPDWTLKKLQQHSGYPNLLSTRLLKQWSNHVNPNGVLIDKVQSIDTLVDTKYTEFKKEKKNSAC